MLRNEWVEKAAVLFQDYYINAGYITTRVEIPSQDLLTKKLKLAVIPGRISEIIIVDNDISKWVLPFSQGDILNIRDIEQGLENIQRTPEVDVKINIVPGPENGTSNLVINTQRKKYGVPELRIITMVMTAQETNLLVEWGIYIISLA